MQVSFHRLAARELREAFDWYERARPGLGDELDAAVKDSIGQIIAFPDAWPKQSRRTRRIRLKRFPYGLVYQVRGEDILIVAVMHLHRRPDYWVTRLRVD